MHTHEFYSMSQSFLIIGASSDIALEPDRIFWNWDTDYSSAHETRIEVNRSSEQGAHLIHGDALDKDAVQSAVDKAKEAGDGHDYWALLIWLAHL
jgi:hypothetical protein